MTFTDKKLAQLIANQTLTEVVTPNTSAKNYITQISIANTSLTTECSVTIYAYGTNKSNILFPKVRVAPESQVTLLSEGFQIPLTSNLESLYIKSDTKDDVIVTIIGTEVI